MKILIDEDVPVRLLKYLTEAGHNALRVECKTSDMAIAKQAKEQERILITLDKDFSNTHLFPPKEFNILLIRIHPPYQEIIIEAIQKLFHTLPPEALKGLTILNKEGHLKVS